MRLRASASRGQATVELAVTSVMFVTVLLFGIYFAEVGFLGMKVQEAANFAVMDATGRKVHDFKLANLSGNKLQAYKYGSTLQGIPGASKAASDRYKDFDGIENLPQLQQVMTAANQINVNCGNLNAMSFDLPNVGSKRVFMPAVRQYLNQLYRDRGGARCTASTKVQAINFPKAFLEGSGQGGLTREQLFAAQPLTLCGVGRAKNGKCEGHYAVLTGDWSFNSVTTDNSNNDTRQDAQGKPIDPNPAYRKLVRDLYYANGDSKQKPGGGWSRAQELMLYGGGFTASDVKTKYDDTKFYMSFAGEEHNFIDTTGGNHKYNTSGVYMAKYPKLKKPKYANCFLGLRREGCK